MTIEDKDYMIRNKIFNIKSRTGRILKIVKEHYLRDDIFCGYELCQKCVMIPKYKKLKHTLTNSNITGLSHIIIPDTNIFLHQMHFFESDIKDNIVILQTVVEEVKSQNYSSYKRLCDLILNPERPISSFVNENHIDTYVETMKGETSNDRNDRAIRVAVKWYNDHISKYGTKSILITNDIGNKQKALQEGLEAYTLKEYFEAFYPNKDELIDKLSSLISKEDLDNDIYDKDHKINFPEHLPSFEVEMGLKSGKYCKGAFMMSRNNFLEADVSLFDENQDLIFIKGLRNMNRAVNQDIVAIQILPESEWVKPSTLLLEDENEIEADDIILPKETHEETIQTVKKDGNKFNKTSSKARSHEPKMDYVRKTGRVVAIIKRKWRPYTGYIQLPPKSKNAAMSSASNWYTFVPTETRIPRIRIQLSRTTLESNLITDLDDASFNDPNESSRRSKLVVVHIDSWPSKSRYPKGHYVRTLGGMDSKESQNEALLIEHDIRTCEYPEKALKCLPYVPWSITPEDLTKRLDLRSKLIVSIDPPGCTDVDDTLHCELLPDGNIEVGVHIADVTHFVKLNSALDLEARDRGTTVYLVDRRIEMLPALLSGDLCSLLANRDRLAFSVIWRIQPATGDILDTRFSKTIIRSSAKLTYEEAQTILDARKALYGEELTNSPVARNDTYNDKWRLECQKMPFIDDPTLAHNPDLLKKISLSILGLYNLSKILKQKRLDKGALVLASSEMKFLMDSETNEPVTMTTKQNLETNSLVEEMMLLANISVASALFNDAALKQWAVLRRHQPPPLGNFDPLIRAAQTLNIKLDIDNGKALADSLDRAEKQALTMAENNTNMDMDNNATKLKNAQKSKKINRDRVIISKSEMDDLCEEYPSDQQLQVVEDLLAEKANTPYLVTLLRVLTARCMMEALYFCSGTLTFPEFFHYGLASEIYTHFTSPIRRYADVMVHRLLAVHIGYEDLDSQMKDKNIIQNICNHLNLRNRNSRNAQRASVELQIQLYFKNKVVDDEAYIIGIRKNALRVLVPKFGLEGSIYLKCTANNEEDILKHLKYNETDSTMVYNSTEQPVDEILIKCFDKVRVRLTLLFNASGESSVTHRASVNRSFNSNKLTIRLIEPRIPGFEPWDMLSQGNAQGSLPIMNTSPSTMTNQRTNKKLKI